MSMIFMSKIDSEPIPNLKKNKDNEIFFLFIIAIILWCFVGYLFYPFLNGNYQYHSYTKAFNSRCDFYIECSGNHIINVTQTNCIPLENNFTCG